MNKKSVISFRLDECEELKLREDADKSGLNISEYIRKCINKEPIIKVYQPKELLRQISGIGNNINQIARHANSTGHVSKHDIEQITKDVNRLKFQMYKLVGAADVLCQ